jgi:DNA (cytosine-5)-methyltransferase 1
LAEDEILLLEIGKVMYYIADIGLRMLSPRELYNAMGFPPDYIIDRDYLGNPYPKNEQVARCGNAVCPPMAAAVVRANFPEKAAMPKFETMAEMMEAVAV